ncbi:FkbM family methyltransferase [Polynucleobacter sp. MWH-UH19D]|uniref:FkbM family methyltransferase n=1 Tax=Polynucleobacter sp. MWH-UH19D TaxID=1855610 RepID=UPI003364CFAC
MIRGIVRWLRARREAKLIPAKKAILGAERMIAVDVGSAEGLQPHWHSYQGIVDFYLFEPHQESCEKLRSIVSSYPYASQFHILPIGLSEFGGERTLYILNYPTGSSIYAINAESEFASPDNSYVFPIREEKIQTDFLDNVLNQHKVDCVDIIKLDVQGAELEVLRGMGDNRGKQLLLAEVEVNLCTGVTDNIGPYHGAPSWGQIDELFVSNGMRLLDLSVAREYRSKAGDSDWYQRNIFDVYENSPSLSARVWEADVVYVRDWRQLIASNNAAAIRKLAVALCGYRFFSEAYFMIEKAEEAGIFEVEAANAIKHNIAVWHRANRNFWQGRGAFWGGIRSILRAMRISQLLRWKQYMWFDYPNG